MKRKSYFLKLKTWESSRVNLTHIQPNQERKSTKQRYKHETQLITLKMGNQ